MPQIFVEDREQVVTITLYAHDVATELDTINRAFANRPDENETYRKNVVHLLIETLKDYDEKRGDYIEAVKGVV